MKLPFFFAVALLSGAIIGAGTFSLPFIFQQLGIGLGVIYVCFFAMVYCFLHWRYAEVLADGKGARHFFFYAKKYLPRGWGVLARIAVLGSLLLALTAYIILSSHFAVLLIGKASMLIALVVWLAGSVLIFVNTSWLGWAEMVGAVSIAVITGVLWVAGVGQEFVTPLVESQTAMTLLLPFGPILFMFSGRAAISKLVSYHEHLPEEQKFPLRRAIRWGTIVPAVVYVVFALAVLRLVPSVTPDTVSSLGVLPPTLGVLVGIIGLLALWTSYAMLGGNAYDILRTDVTKSRVVAGLIPVGLPMALVLLGFQNFLEVVSLSGGLFLAVEGIFVQVIWERAGHTNSAWWKTLPFYIVFLLAIVYQIVSYF